MAPTNPPPKKGGNFLTQKAGPLPVWGWIAVVVVGYLLYKRLSGSSSSSTATGTQVPASSTETITTPYGSYSGPSQGGIPQSILTGPGSQPVTSTSTGTSSGGGGTGTGSTSPPPAITVPPFIPAPTPGNTGAPTPGSGGGSTPGGGYTLISSNVAQTVQNDLNSGTPVYYYAGTPGASPGGQVGVTPGGGWEVGGSTNFPGNPSGPPGGPSGYYTKS